VRLGGDAAARTHTCTAPAGEGSSVLLGKLREGIENKMGNIALLAVSGINLSF
jgi:hypothetical protein